MSGVNNQPETERTGGPEPGKKPLLPDVFAGRVDLGDGTHLDLVSTGEEEGEPGPEEPKK
jgi:hypothetical protein